ncbi:MAG TPA: SUMF1/EgtB/PvdO family nonheme iron enzyme [Solirubrobacteraceae bacterium]|jgi:iron(II)-dependent oxidoreductase|nr:SUMF1/EgtB/PvdO family nonheme iron enzyme [Solirubrobacteraceae bacterium]
MATDAIDSSCASAGVTEVLDGLEHARARTLALIAHLADEQLERVHSPIMSPLVWDLGHIAAYEDLWIAHRLGELPLLRGDLAALYDAFETPRAIRGEIEALDPAQARDYMAEVRARTLQLLAERGVDDGVICEMVVRHELQHGETMRQTLVIAGLLNEADAATRRRPLDARGEQQWIELPAGPFEMGAVADGFAYDNERPRHTLQTDAFQIASRPVSNGAWLEFAEQGGYERRELWSQPGWAWLAEQEQALDPAILGGHPQAAVCHVSWFEATAFARFSDARLPTEAEWEKAASAQGSALGGVGRVWEWTQSAFRGYPGFVAHPYREYSEVFFGEDYRVLRGGSWATDARVANRHFRNWDLPQRRQIFAGVRLARDPA